MKTRLSIRLFFTCLPVAAALVLLPDPVWAVQVSWDANTGVAGAQDGAGTWSTAANNWWNGAGNVVWPNTFNDEAIVGAGNGTAGVINISGTVNLNKLTFDPAGSGVYQVNVGVLNFGGTTPTISSVGDGFVGGTIAGTGGLTKTGNGFLVLFGPNSYTGTTTISSGSLYLGGGFTTGSMSPASPIVNNSAFYFQRSDTITQGIDFGVISGSGSVAKIIGGTTILSSPNTYSGGTFIYAGTIKLGSGTGIPAGGNVTVASGTFFDTVGTFNNLTGPIGIVTLNGGSMINSAAGNSDYFLNQLVMTGGTVDQSLTGAFYYHFTNAGAAITVNASSTTSQLKGLTSGSHLIVNNSGAALPISVASGTTPSGIDLEVSTKLANGGLVTDFTKTGLGTMLLSNTGNNANLLVSAGRLRVDAISSGTVGPFGSGTLTIDGGIVSYGGASSTSTIKGFTLGSTVGTGIEVSNAAATLSITGSLTGSGGVLTKSGAGTLQLSSATHTGPTTISAGKLIVTNVGNGFASGVSLAPGTVFELNSTTGFNTFDVMQFNGSPITGTGTITKTGPGIVQYQNATVMADFAGTVDIQAGTFGSSQTSGTIGKADSLMTVNVGASGLFDMRVSGANGARIDKLTGTGKVGNTWPSTAVLTVGTGNGSSTFAGQIQGNSTNGFADDTTNPNTGSVSLVKTGTGVFTLSGANTYAGVTTVNGGMLVAGSNTALGAGDGTAASGTVVASGATLRLAAGVTIGAGEALSISGNGVANSGAIQLSGGNATYNGPIALTGITDFNAAFNTLTFNGPISISDSLLGQAHGNTGVFNFNGPITGNTTGFDDDLWVHTSGVTNLNAANTYKGTTTIFNESTLNANVANALPTVNGRTAMVLDHLNADPEILNIGGSAGFPAGASQSIASLVGDHPNNRVTLGANNLTIGFGTAPSTNGTANANFPGAISGTGGIVKDQGSTQILSGPNTYTGLTTVSAGTLQIGNNDASTGLGSSSFTVSSGAQLVFSRNTDSTDFTNQSISGNGDVVFTGQSTGFFRLTNSYTGTQTNSGKTTVNFDAPVGGTASYQRTLWLEKDNVFSNSSVLDLQSGKVYLRGQTSQGLKTAGLTGVSGTSLSTDQASVQKVTINAASGSHSFSGVIGMDTSFGSSTNNLSLTKTGAGTQTLTGANTYTGGTIISGGTLIANETIAAGLSATGVGPVTVSGSGTLAGGNATGTVGSIRGILTVNSGGSVAPGIGGPGVLTVNGNTAFAGGSTLQIQIDGSAAGSGYDRLRVNGTVNLGGATLLRTGSFVPAVGQSFVLVENDGSDPVSGTFENLPQGTVVPVNGVSLYITYVGGDGNDVELTAPVAVTSFADSGAGSLRDMIDTATPGDAFVFDPSLNGKTITLTSGELLIDKTLSLDASALPAGITISGGGASRVFNITSGSTVTMTGVTITGGNSGNGYGGGIYNSGTLALLNSTVYGNKTGAGYYGGGIAIVSPGSLNATNCTIAHNSAFWGGGVYVNNGASAAITHCTISTNSATSSGGGVQMIQGSLAITDSILAGNAAVTGPDIGRDIVSSVTTGGTNLIGNNATVTSEFPAGLLHGTAANPVDPRLAPLGNYGGSTPTMPPLVGSPVIDAGGATSLVTDQRGFPRVVNGDLVAGAVADIGAVEAGPVTLVSNSSDGGIRAALADATAPGARILFNLLSTDSVITLTAGELSVSGGRTIFIDASSLVDGTGAVAMEPDPVRPGSMFIPRGVTMSGGNASRVFTIGNSNNVAMHRLTVTGGSSTWAGGGILNYGTLTLVESTISNCTTTYRGGGLFNFGAGALIRSAVHDNHADDIGGGIVNEIGTLGLANSTVAENASSSHGGGIFNFSSLTLTNSTISKNTASEGGGVETQDGVLQLSNTILAGNTAPSFNPDLVKAGSDVITSSGGNLLGSEQGLAGIFPAGLPNGNGDLVGTSAAPIDPMLASLADNGGPTKTMAFVGNSPAINAGVSTVLTSFTDQRGYARILADGLDIGAFESGAVNFNQTGLTLYANLPSGPLNTRLPDVVDGLVAFWPFSDSSSLGTDIVGGSVLTANGGASQVTAGRLGGGLELDGNSQFLSGTVNNLPVGNSPYTQAAWFKPTALGARGIVGWGNYGSNGQVNALRLGSSGNSLGHYWWNNDLATADLGSDFLDGHWHHVATTCDGTTRRIYLDGIQVAQDTPGIHSATAANFRIGSTNVNENFAGTLDDVAIYNKALTAAEVASLAGSSTEVEIQISTDANFLPTISTLTGTETPYPGLSADIYLGPDLGSGNIAHVNANSPSGSTIIPDINWAHPGNYPANGYPDASPAADNGGANSTNLFAQAVPGHFGGDENGYGVDLTGQIHIPGDASRNGIESIRFHDGVDDYAYLEIDGVVLIDNVSYTNSGGTDNGGGSQATLDVSAAKYDDGEWVGFRMVMWEGTGGDNCALAWDALDQTGSDDLTGGIDSSLGTYNPANLPDGDQVNFENSLTDWIPPENLRHIEAKPGMLDGARLSAAFSYPSGVAQDTLGNIFIADTGNNRIRMLSPAGVVSTIAGTGGYGFADGSGPTALFKFPAAVAIGPDGNLYVADTLNHRIRKLTRPAISGLPWTVTTLAGTGTSGFFEGAGTVARFSHPHGLALDVAGNVFVADSFNHRIRKVTPGGVVSTYAGSGAVGSANDTRLASSFNVPFGVVIDSAGNLFVADRDNHRIRRVTPSAVTTFAGSGAVGFGNSGIGADATFNTPAALAIDKDDNLYVSDQNNHAIRKIAPDAVVTTVAGLGAIAGPGVEDGNSTDARLNFPAGLAVDLSGNLIVADTGNHRVRRIQVKPISIMATRGSEDAFGVRFSAVIDAVALGLDPNVKYYFRWHSLLDDSSQMLGQSFSMIPLPSVVTEVADNLTPTSARLNATVNPLGNAASVVFEYSTDPALLSPAPVTVSAGSFNGSSTVPASATIPQPATAGATVYFRAVATNARGVTQGAILSFSHPNPSVVTEAADNLTRTAARLNATVDPMGSPITVKFRYSTDPNLNGPLKVTTLAGTGVAGLVNGSGTVASFDNPQGVAIYGTDSYVADRLNHRIRKITSSGVVSTFAGSTAGFDNTGSGKFDHPSGVAADASGNLYVADEYNHVIRKITVVGGVATSVSTYAGTGVAGFADGASGTAKFLFPTGVAVDSSGNVYVADSGNHRIRMIAAVGGAVTTVAGTGVAGFANGVAGAAQFNNPLAVAAGTAGKVFVADTGNHRIRVILGGTVSTLAGSGANGFFDGAGSSATFSSPSGIAVDGSGVAFVSDRGNHRVRRVAADGQVTTVAGSGIAGLLNSPVTGLYPATASRFDLPSGIAVDGTGNLFITQQGNPALRRISRGTLPEATVTPDSTGSGERIVSADIEPPLLAGATYYYRAFGTNALETVQGDIVSFTAPTEPGIAVSSGTETLTHAQTTVVDFGITPVAVPSTRQFTISNTGGWPLGDIAITVPAGFGFTSGIASVEPGGSATFSVTLTAATAGTFAGNVDIASDDPAQGVFSFPITGKVLALPVVTTQDATDVTATGALLNADVNPMGSSATAWFEYSEDPELDGVLVTTAAGVDSGFLNGAALSAQFNQPNGLATDAAGNTYVADTLNHRIRKITAGGSVVTVAGTGVPGYTNGPGASARFNAPVGVVVGAGGILYVSDSLNHCIRAISPTGVVSTFSGFGVAGFTEGASGGARFNTPKGLAIGPAGILYVADSLNQRIRKVATDGSVTTLAVLNAPAGIAVSGSGVVYVTETGSHAIQRIQSGGTVDLFAGAVATPAFNDATGTAARFSSPVGLVVDSTGRIYVADKGNNRIRRITSEGVVTTVAGSGTQGAADGAGEVAQFDIPASVTLDVTGAVIVGELAHSRIRSIAPSSIVVPAATGLTGIAPLTVSTALTGLVDGTAYYFRVFATNGGGTTFGAILSMGGGALPPSLGWQVENFGVESGNPLIAGWDADPSHDGIVNLLKYAFGLDPNLSSQDGLPVLSTNGGLLRLTYAKVLAATDLAYIPEWSSNLQDWSPLGISEEILSTDAGIQQTRATIPFAGAPAKYLRLRVTFLQP